MAKSSVRKRESGKFSTNSRVSDIHQENVDLSLQDLPGFAPACDRRNRYWPCHGHIEEVLLQDFEVENLSYGVQKYYYDFVDKNDGGVAASILEYKFGTHGGVTTEPKCQPRIVCTQQY